MDDTAMTRAYRAYRRMFDAVADIERIYGEFVEGEPTKVFDDYPGLVRRKAEYTDGYLHGAFEASDAIGKHLRELHTALMDIDRQLAPMRGAGR